jgi:hypothetical protein
MKPGQDRRFSGRSTGEEFQKVKGKGGRFDDLSGQRFGRWLVTSSWERRVLPKGGKVVYWLCRCSCPAHKEKFVPAGKLKSQESRSCGCLDRELSAQRKRKEIRDVDHPLYRIWDTLKQRCYNQRSRDYPRFGARGVTMCDRWRNSFHAFAQDIPPRPSNKHHLHLKENDGGYHPENVEWLTAQERSKRRKIFSEQRALSPVC